MLLNGLTLDSHHRGANDQDTSWAPYRVGPGTGGWPDDSQLEHMLKLLLFGT